ncbi:hypothetical protein Leryth_027571 [Lithospermum erythrorhizon]|nr:hypothetical protein Leryth_027571 [Lithospermum erythrorhizon]
MTGPVVGPTGKIYSIKLSCHHSSVPLGGIEGPTLYYLMFNVFDFITIFLLGSIKFLLNFLLSLKICRVSF